jgi:hypothetical protein
MFSGMSTYAKLFGRKNPKIESQGIEGTVSSSGFSGDAFAKIIEEGGWFRSDKRYPVTAPLSTAQDAGLDSTVQSMMLAVHGFADALGVKADQIDGYTKAINLTLTNDDAQNQKLLADLFGQIGDELSLKLVPDLDKFTKSGETASATLQRLAGDFKGTDQVAQLLGFSADKLFGSASMQSAAAREHLIDLAGGLSTLNQQAAFFNQNFLTDAERLAPVSAALDKALASLGLATIPTTREEFKTLVNCLIESGAAATETGAKQLDSLLALGDAFAQVHPVIDQTVNSLQAMKDAASGLLGGVDSAYSVLEKVVAREKAAAQTSVDAHTAAVNKLQGLSQALHSALDSSLSADQKLGQRASAQAEIRADLAITKAGGTLSDVQTDSLKKALGAVTQDASGQFSTYQDYLRDLYRTQNDIAALGDVTDSQLSVEQQALKAAQDQLKSLDGVLASAQSQIDILKGVDTNGLTLVQAMDGLTKAILSANQNPIVSATSAINGAYQQYLGRAPDAEGLQWWQNAAASGAPVSQIVDGISHSTEADLNKLYQSVLGRAPDAEGLAVWMNAYGPQMDEAERADWMKDAQATDEYKKLHPFAVGTNFIPEDMPALVHKGERIIPAADNRALMARLQSPGSGDNAALVAEFKALRDEVKQLREANSAENRAIAKGTQETAGHLDGVVNGQITISTKAVPA